jgi:hypothetical protein
MQHQEGPIVRAEEMEGWGEEQQHARGNHVTLTV